MAIAFSCSCGKPLRARDEFAGRKIRCPACETVVVIPTLAAVSVDPVEVNLTSGMPAAPGETPAVPLAKPVSMKVPNTLIPPPSRTETAEHIPSVAAAVSATPLPSPWADRSLEQTVTPWLGDDRERFNPGIELPGDSRIWLVLVALFVGLALTAAFFFG